VLGHKRVGVGGAFELHNKVLFLLTWGNLDFPKNDVLILIARNMLEGEGLLLIIESFSDVFLDTKGLKGAIGINPEIIAHRGDGLHPEHLRLSIQVQRETVELTVHCLDVFLQGKLLKVVFLEEKLRQYGHTLFIIDIVSLESEVNL
jgi:hypothetical protein